MYAWLVTAVVLLAITNTIAVPHHYHFPNKRQAEYVAGLGSYEVVTPRRVTRDGGHLSHHLHHTHDNTFAAGRRKRHANLDPYRDQDLHYMITLDGKEHQVTLRPNRRFLAPHAVLERRKGGSLLRKEGDGNSSSSRIEVIGTRPSCHYHGYVRNHRSSRVAVSACHGLTGYLRTDDDEFLIEPVRDHAHAAHDSPHPHVVYRRSSLPTAGAHTCSTPDAFEKAFHSRALWEKSRRPHRSSGDGGLPEEEEVRRKRSVSVERNVEVTVVADKKMVDYYSNEDINTYILTVMNMVSSVYHDASIGNAVNIYVVRIMLLEDRQYEEELDISHNADNTLRSFCHWQQMINPGNETHPYHHDVAVLITRFNICSRVTDRCATLGVSEIAGMCQPLRSCNVNEDTGLQIAYTIAHELGHNFGMNHDGPQNGCESQYGRTQHVMSPHLTNDAIPVTWSNCSREEITHFLDRDWGACLEDEPPEIEYTFPELPPGAMYDADHQCRLSFGSDATHCLGIEGIERVCQTLWCHLDNRCITRMEPAAEGTQCGKHKWCSTGECVTMGERPAAIHGNWGAWSGWSDCSRTCGAGVSVAHRHCDNPAPANGGRYCTGDRKKYRICNTQECPENGVSFRAVQCSQHGQQPYKGENRTWLPVMFDHSPCQLDCKPDNEFYSVKLRETVIDGTPCKPGTRDMCIHGVCKRVACDWTIEGAAQEDRCGLCHGDGTQCVTTRGFFNLTRQSGYVPAVTFPIDARNVKVQEVRDAANYLAVRDNATGHYFLNGNWIIQWSGEYSAEGTMMYYSREGETEELFLPGPLKRPLTLMLLFQTENPGLAWEYTLPHQNATYTPTFAWHHSDWSVCTVTCGGGTQVSRVQCLEKEAGLVDEQYCSDLTRPDDHSRVCNNHACPAWWWSGPWQPCSITCGDGGLRRRTVICVRSFGPTEQMALLDSACDESEKPHETEVCPSLPICPQPLEWSVGLWSQSCTQDPCEYEQRQVLCVAPRGNCDPLSRPPDRRQCGNITCGVWEVGQWSKCSAPCGEGVQFRRVSCVGGLACRERDEPKSAQECVGDCLEEETFLEIDDELLHEPELTTTTEPQSRTTAEPQLTTTTESQSTITTESQSTIATESQSTTTTEPQSTTTTESQSTTTTEPQSTTTTESQSTITTEPQSTTTTESQSTITTEPQSTTVTESQSTITTEPQSTTTTESQSTITTEPQSTATTESQSTITTEPQSTTVTEAQSTTITEPTLNTSSEYPTTPTSIPASTSGAPHATISTTVKPYGFTATDPAVSGPPPTEPTTTATLPTTFGETTRVPVTEVITTVRTVLSSTISQSVDETTIESTVLTTVPSSTTTTTEKTAVPNPTTVLPSTVESDATSLADSDSQTPEITTETQNDVLVSSPATTSQLPTVSPEDSESQRNKSGEDAVPETHMEVEEVERIEGQNKLDNVSDVDTSVHILNATSTEGKLLDKHQKNDTVIEEPLPEDVKVQDKTFNEDVLGSLPEIDHDNISVMETLNEVDVDSKPDTAGDRTVFDDESLVDEKQSKPETPQVPRDQPHPPSTTQPPPEEEEEEEDLLASDEPIYMEDPTELDIYTEVEEPFEVEEYLDQEKPEERRPNETIVDKIDVDDFEVIEIIELPAKGNKKKKRKKVLLHTGAEAVDVLHELAEQQEAKKTTTTPLPETILEDVPEYEWSVGQWSECNAECGGGVWSRSVECVDLATGIPVNPRLCRRSRPSYLEACNTVECGEWVVGEWGECSATCNVGERLRSVRCPEGQRCPSTTRPPEVEPCHQASCLHWVEGPWSLCTKRCGGGYQIRHVKCVDVRTQEVSESCPRDSKPKHKMACHNERCPKNRRGQQRRCRDRLDTKLCRRLKHMCNTKFIRAKCCRTCLRRHI